MLSSTETPRGMLAAALDYAARRLPVFPCVARGKSPATHNGFHDATTNPETIRRFWRIADRNIGIPTGPVSGFRILDIDGAAGDESLRALESKHGPLPPTRQAITGSGRHVWFAYTGPPIQSAAGRIAPGIDTRGDGGYIIAPPSVHENGRAYEWAATSVDDLAVAPEWLIALTRKPFISERALASIKAPRRVVSSGAYGQAALDREFAALAAAAPGGRNHALNRTAFRLFQLVAGGELGRDQVVQRLLDACDRNGLTKEDGERSVTATIRSGAAAGLKFPRARNGSAA
jgi:hypothetical protein